MGVRPQGCRCFFALKAQQAEGRSSLQEAGRSCSSQGRGVGALQPRQTLRVVILALQGPGSSATLLGLPAIAPVQSGPPSKAQLCSMDIDDNARVACSLPFVSGCGTDGARAAISLIYQASEYCASPKEYGPPDPLQSMETMQRDGSVPQRCSIGLDSDAASQKTIISNLTYLKADPRASSLRGNCESWELVRQAKGSLKTKLHAITGAKGRPR